MPVDYAIDNAIFAATVANITPPYAIVRPFLDLDAEAKNLLQKMKGHVAKQEAVLAQRLDEGERSRQHLTTVTADRDVMPHHIQNLQTLAEKIEGKAAELASDLSGALKRIDRMAKQVLQISPASQRPALKAQFDRMHELVNAEVEEYLAMAIFLRALRSEHDPESRGGPEFSTGQELREYLNALVA